MGEAGFPASAQSGHGHLLQLGRQPGDFARAGVLVDDPLGHGAHQFGLRLHEGILGRRAMRLREGENVSSLAPVVESDEENGDAAETPVEAPTGAPDDVPSDPA